MKKKQTMNIKFTDNSKEVSDNIKEALLRGLEKCGLMAEGYAKKLCPVDTGNLRNSITHEVVEDENAVYIGTNNEYAAYVELGTGIYAEGGGGRPTPWVYQDANGNWHYTHGQKPKPSAFELSGSKSSDASLRLNFSSASRRSGYFAPSAG